MTVKVSYVCRCSLQTTEGVYCLVADRLALNQLSNGRKYCFSCGIYILPQRPIMTVLLVFIGSRFTALLLNAQHQLTPSTHCINQLLF